MSVTVFDFLAAVRDEMTGSGALVTMTVDDNGLWIWAKGDGNTLQKGIKRADFLALDLVDAVVWAGEFRRAWDKAQG
jgi:hypothetical protein